MPADDLPLSCPRYGAALAVSVRRGQVTQAHLVPLDTKLLAWSATDTGNRYAIGFVRWSKFAPYILAAMGAMAPVATNSSNLVWLCIWSGLFLAVAVMAYVSVRTMMWLPLPLQRLVSPDNNTYSAHHPLQLKHAMTTQTPSVAIDVYGGNIPAEVGLNAVQRVLSEPGGGPQRMRLGRLWQELAELADTGNVRSVVWDDPEAAQDTTYDFQHIADVLHDLGQPHDREARL